MAKRLQYRRLLFLVLLLGVAFVGLGYRLVDLQVIRHTELAAKAQQNTQQEILLEPRRGDILDAKGNLLATSIFVKTVCADPVLLGDSQAKVARAIAPVLGLNEGELYNRLLPRTRVNDKGQTVTNRYVVLKRKVSIETWEKVKVAMSNLSFTTNEVKLSPKSFSTFCSDLKTKSVFTDPINDQQRYYPNTNLAAHVLGYVGMDEREFNGSKVLETAGKDGVEAALNSKLSGVRGWRVTEADKQKRELVALRDQEIEARDGLNVVLTIDSVIQNIMETALADGMREHSPISISGIAVRPRTGEILALATLPTFDPNNPGSSSADARRNRVITDMAEPGSTFKIVVVSGALNDAVVSLRDQFDCENGAFPFAGRVLHDHERYGVLTVEQIITKSSNIGAAKIGIKLGANRLYEYICDFGFGQRTGIPLPGEVRGLSYAPKDWTKVTIAQIPMGHAICATRLQMVMAMCAMANKGELMRPMLVDRLEDREGRTVVKYTPQSVRRVVSEKANRLMVTALKTVVSEEGTAKSVMLEHYSVAGKTGTAQKVENGTYVRKYLSSFIGFFPAENPELCISIVLDEPKNGYYGGQAAGPVFKQIAERAANYLNIRPDLKDTEPSSQETVADAADAPIRRVAARPLNKQ